MLGPPAFGIRSHLPWRLVDQQTWAGTADIQIDPLWMVGASFTYHITYTYTPIITCIHKIRIHVKINISITGLYACSFIAHLMHKLCVITYPNFHNTRSSCCCGHRPCPSAMSRVVLERVQQGTTLEMWIHLSQTCPKSQLYQSSVEQRQSSTDTHFYYESTAGRCPMVKDEYWP